MRKTAVVIASLIMLANQSTSTSAQDLSNASLYCPMLGNYAELVMGARWNGMTQETVESKILPLLKDQFLAEMVPTIIDIAYLKPWVGGKAQQIVAVAEFRSEMSGKCFNP